MAIWLWILAAWAISFLALKGRKIRLEHYVWMLLPVDMYGLSVAGVTLKPYAIFSGLLLFRMLLSGRHELSVKSRASLISGVITVLLIAVNAFNNDTMQSMISTVMIAVVWACTMIYMSDCRDGTPEDVAEVLLAAGIGFGAVFVIANLFLKLNIILPGMVADTRAEPGIFMSMNNVYHGQLLRTLRLRGFTIDPNQMVGTFLLCSSTALFRLIRGKGKAREILALILSVWCVILSNSRMGLICCVLVCIVSLVLGYQMAGQRAKNCMKLLLLCLILALIIATISGVMTRIIRSVMSSYENRSGLNDEYGRFTIWKEAVTVLCRENLFFGIGHGRMQYYTAMSRACHNTWLEFICAYGLLMGGLCVVYFTAVLLGGFGYSFRRRTDGFAWTMTLSTMGVMLSLLSVDYLTSSYLWFCSAMVAAVSSGCWRK